MQTDMHVRDMRAGTIGGHFSCCPIPGEVEGMQSWNIDRNKRIRHVDEQSRQQHGSFVTNGKKRAKN
jgi:hypothetical protein